MSVNYPSQSTNGDVDDETIEQQRREQGSFAATDGSAPGWAVETMMMINKLTPDIKGKAFDPDWFMLRQRLEEAERVMNTAKAQNEKLRHPAGETEDARKEKDQ